MVCAGIEGVTGLVNLLAWPTSCDTYFYAKIMAAFFIVIAFTVYRYEQRKYTRSDFLSAMGVAAISTIFVSLLGTLIGIISVSIYVKILVINLIIIAVWFFKR